LSCVSVESQDMFSCFVCRANWSYWRRNGSDQPGHASCREEPGRNGEVLWTVCFAVEAVCSWRDIVSKLWFRISADWLCQQQVLLKEKNVSKDRKVSGEIYRVICVKVVISNYYYYYYYYTRFKHVKSFTKVKNLKCERSQCHRTNALLYRAVLSLDLKVAMLQVISEFTVSESLFQTAGAAWQKAFLEKLRVAGLHWRMFAPRGLGCLGASYIMPVKIGVKWLLQQIVFYLLPFLSSLCIQHIRPCCSISILSYPVRWSLPSPWITLIVLIFHSP